jgi:hypothetical protein
MTTYQADGSLAQATSHSDALDAEQISEYREVFALFVCVPLPFLWISTCDLSPNGQQVD